MRLDKGGLTDYLMFPVDETKGVIEAITAAEKSADLKALQWCARRLAFLYEDADITSDWDRNYPARLFNREWNKDMKIDPPPESIAPVIAKIGQEDDPKIDIVKTLEGVVETVKVNVCPSSVDYVNAPLIELLTAIKKGEVL